MIRRKTITPRKELFNLLEERIENDFSKYKYDQNVELFLKITGFELEDQPDNVFVYLRKNIGKVQMEINFEAVYQMNFTGIDELKIEKTNQKVESYADFNVFFTNTDNNSGIFVDCSTCNRILVFNRVMHSDNMSVFKDPVASSKGYLGRELEKVKRPYLDTLTRYIQSFGIDEDVLEFIEKYSSDKEYRLYMSWLVKIRDFLYKKKEKE
jgi:hypothetical protein